MYYNCPDVDFQVNVGKRRAQNNDRSTENDGPKIPRDRSLFYLTGHFDRPHYHAFQCDCWRLELKHETLMYRNKFLIVCFTVSVSVSMHDRSKTEFDRARIKLTGHFDRRLTISPVILRPAMNALGQYSCHLSIQAMAIRIIE